MNKLGPVQESNPLDDLVDYEPVVNILENFLSA